MKIYIITMTLFFTLFGCDKGPKSPEGMLKMYVNDLTSNEVNKEYFEKYTTGPLLEKVQSLSDEEFKEFIKIGKLKNAKIDISNKTCTDSSCNLTYIVKYDILEAGKQQFKTEVKKIAVLEKAENLWKISEVTNVKTYIEGSSPIEVTE